jgi:flavorubredoxin
MKALVTYFSESGNTEKLAQAIYEGVNASAKEIASISEASANEADVIFVGFPVHASSVPTNAALCPEPGVEFVGSGDFWLSRSGQTGDN